jgi:hypothetical protein
MRTHNLSFKVFNKDLNFTNLMFPLILRSKDNDILSFLLKQEGFFFHSYDFNSFVVQSLYEGWHIGLRTFLFSNAAQFNFSGLPWEAQRAIVDRIFRVIGEMDEPKLRHSYVSSILEETITKRPYSKHLALLLLRGELTQTVDGTRLARECLTNLTSEDFMQLSQMEGVGMMEYERVYPRDQGTALENELAKIMMRYSTEGKVPAYNNSARKQVTFQERQASIQPY